MIASSTSNGRRLSISKGRSSAMRLAAPTGKVIGRSETNRPSIATEMASGGRWNEARTFATVRWRAVSASWLAVSIPSSMTCSTATVRKPAWTSAARTRSAVISIPRVRAISLDSVVMEDAEPRHGARERGRRRPAIVEVHDGADLRLRPVDRARDLDGEDLRGGDEAPVHLGAEVGRDLDGHEEHPALGAEVGLEHRVEVARAALALDEVQEVARAGEEGHRDEVTDRAEELHEAHPLERIHAERGRGDEGADAGEEHLGRRLVGVHHAGAVDRHDAALGVLRVGLDERGPELVVDAADEAE